MKSILRMMLALTLCLLVASSACAEAATAWYYNGAFYYNTYTAKQTAPTLMRVATRSGPGTNYDELGSYHKKGYELTVISKAYDERNGIWWLQVEFTYRDSLRRAYTGLKRVDIDINTVQEDMPLYVGTVIAETTAYYGPGTQYAPHSKTVKMETEGIIYALEDGYALFEYYDGANDGYSRVWLPMNSLYWAENVNY